MYKKAYKFKNQVLEQHFAESSSANAAIYEAICGRMDGDREFTLVFETEKVGEGHLGSVGASYRGYNCFLLRSEIKKYLVQQITPECEVVQQVAEEIMNKPKPKSRKDRKPKSMDTIRLELTYVDGSRVTINDATAITVKDGNLSFQKRKVVKINEYTERTEVTVANIPLSKINSVVTLAPDHMINISFWTYEGKIREIRKWSHNKQDILSDNFSVRFVR